MKTVICSYVLIFFPDLQNDTVNSFPNASVNPLRLVSLSHLSPLIQELFIPSFPSLSLLRVDLGYGIISQTPCLPRKEVIQPHLPIRLPCYDFTPVIGLTFDGCSLAVRSPALGAPNSHGVTGGVYKARERIHRDILIRDY